MEVGTHKAGITKASMVKTSSGKEMFMLEFKNDFNEVIGKWYNINNEYGARDLLRDVEALNVKVKDGEFDENKLIGLICYIQVKKDNNGFLSPQLLTKQEITNNI